MKSFVITKKIYSLVSLYACIIFVCNIKNYFWNEMVLNNLIKTKSG